jgi:hypothetical protein
MLEAPAGAADQMGVAEAFSRGSRSGLSPGVGSGVGSGVGAGVGPGVGSGVGAAVGSGVGAGVGPGVGSGVGAGVGPGVRSGVRSGVGRAVGALAGVASGVADGPGVVVEPGAGVAPLDGLTRGGGATYLRSPPNPARGLPPAWVIGLAPASSPVGATDLLGELVACASGAAGIAGTSLDCGASTGFVSIEAGAAPGDAPKATMAIAATTTHAAAAANPSRPARRRGRDLAAGFVAAARWVGTDADSG